MEPIVRGLTELYGDEVTFLRLNAREEGQAAFEAGNLPGHPSYVLLLPDGSETWRGFGVLSFEDIEMAIQASLEASD